MKVILHCACALALFAFVFAKPCVDDDCFGYGSYGGFSEQYSYTASGQRFQAGYNGAEGNNGLRRNNGGSFGMSEGYTGIMRPSSSGGYNGGSRGPGSSGSRVCPTCGGVHNFGNGNHNSNKITIRHG